MAKMVSTLVCIPCGRELLVTESGTAYSEVWCCGIAMGPGTGSAGKKKAAKKKATAKKAARKAAKKAAKKAGKKSAKKSAKKKAAARKK